MVHKATTSIIAALLASLFVVNGALCQVAGNKAKMLGQLTRSSTTHLGPRASTLAASSPTETAQLAIDLIFYRWATHLANQPAEVKNIDLIISALTKAVNDDTVNWAAAYFAPSIKNPVTTPLPPRDDPRVQCLRDLSSEYKTAVERRESSPVEAVTALLDAARMCQELYPDISEALIFKDLGDHYLDMMLYGQAEGWYDRAVGTFSAYGLIASSAGVYDSWGDLNAMVGRSANATDNYAQAGRLWEELIDPIGYKYRDMAGQEYMKAGLEAGDTDKALDLMNGHGLPQLRRWAHATKQYRDFDQRPDPDGRVPANAGRDERGSVSALRRGPECV